MTYAKFLGWAAFYLLVSAFPLQAGAKKENNPSTTSEYFTKPLYFYAQAHIIKIHPQEKDPYVDLKIDGKIASFEDRPLRHHEDVSLVQMVNYAQEHAQKNFLLTNLDQSKEVFFESASLEQKGPLLIRLHLRDPSKATHIQELAKQSQTVLLMLLNY